VTPLPQSVSPACGLTWQDGVHYGQAAVARAGCGLGADVPARAEPDTHRSARACIPPSSVIICSLTAATTRNQSVPPAGIARTEGIITSISAESWLPRDYAEE
jgi:hypothetical protein